MKLNVIEQEERLVIEPAPVPMHLERKDGILVAVPEVPVPTLATDQVRKLLESGRR